MVGYRGIRSSDWEERQLQGSHLTLPLGGDAPPPCLSVERVGGLTLSVAAGAGPQRVWLPCALHIPRKNYFDQRFVGGGGEIEDGTGAEEMR